MNEPQESPLLFKWKQARLLDRLDWRLAFCLFAAVLVHASAFYFFRVVYPPADHAVPRSKTIAILHHDDEDARRLLNQLEDRIFFVWPGEGTLDSQSPAGSSVEFTPSFAGHEIQLRKAPSPHWKVDQQSSNPSKMLVFPVPESQTTFSSADDVRPAPFSVKILPKPDRGWKVAAEMMKAALDSPTGWVLFYAGVDARGQIRNWVELERARGVDSVDTSAMAQAIRLEALEQDPEAEPVALQWFWIEVYW